MKLIDLLAELGTEDLVRIAREYAHIDESFGTAQLRAAIDGVLRSHRFLQDFIFNRQPPTFAILTLLLEADGNLGREELEELAQTETVRLCAAVDQGLVVSRQDKLRVYRRVLQQARSNDYMIDSVEASILTVLRHELEITQVEHFLIEHHTDLREFWQSAEMYRREFDALVEACILFVRDNKVIVPDDQIVALRRVLGVDMSRNDTRRLYGHLSNQELHDCLGELGLPTGGNKDDRIERLVINMVQPRSLLGMLNGERLKEICREVGATSSGSKEDLVDRLVHFVGSDKDIAPEPETEQEVREEHALNREQFGSLFELLRGHELVSLLIDFDLKRSGSKDVQIQTLWDAERSENTLLVSLAAADLDEMLRRAELKQGGSKPDRVERLLSHFSSPPTEPHASEQGGMTLLEAAQQVLDDGVAPLRANEIWSEIQRRHLYASAGKTPVDTLHAELLRASLGQAVTGRRRVRPLCKVAPMTFGLVKWLAAEESARLTGLEQSLDRRAQAGAAANTRDAGAVRIWIEITDELEHVGKYLASPTENAAGANTYRIMSEPKEDDLVIHFVSEDGTRRITGTSRVAARVETETVPGADGRARARFRIALSNYTAFANPPTVASLIEDNDELLRSETQTADHYPFYLHVDAIRLVQGRYLTRCTDRLSKAIKRLVT